MNKLFPAALFLVGGAVFALEKAPSRPPAVAGSFYPADPGALARLADAQWAAAPAVPLKREVLALLVPHAGLEYSGPTAARAWRAAAGGPWDSVLVIGTAHRRLVRGAALYPGDYATPEGPAAYDAELGRALLEASPLIAAEPEAHDQEHSIEVQLPFLRRALPGARLAALVMNAEDPEVARAVGAAVARAVRGRRVLLVASSDLSHYPARGDAQPVDMTSLFALGTLDASLFHDTNRLLLARGVPGLETAYCGEGAVAAVLAAAKSLGAGEMRLIARANSGDGRPGAEKTVGYAAAAFLRAPARPAAPFAMPIAERRALLALARRAAAERLAGRVLEEPLSAEPRFNLPAAVFVTLRRKGELRGCIGSFSAVEGLAQAVASRAAASATEDRRFAPVTADELPDIKIEISILSPMRAVTGPLAVRRGDGVMLSRGAKSGLFLPEVWESLPDKAAFLAELCEQKAGLPRDCAADPETRLKVFTTTTFSE